MFGVLLLFERGKEKFKPYICRFFLVEVHGFRAGVCDGVEERKVNLRFDYVPSCRF